MEALQKAKKEAKRNPFLVLIDSEFERLKRISELAKQLTPEERQDYINKMITEDVEVDLVPAQNEN